MSFKPNVVCFRCKQNIITCKCVYPPSAGARWVSELRTLYSQTQVRPRIPNQRNKNMRFTFEGRQFAIDFVREHKLLNRVNDEGVDIQVKSKYPSTTVNILELDRSAESASGSIKNATVFRTATVGAWHKEKTVNHEIGRQRALRSVTRTLPKEMRPLVWETYFNRGKVAGNPPAPPTSPAAVLRIKPEPPIVDGVVVPEPIMQVS